MQNKLGEMKRMLLCFVLILLGADLFGQQVESTEKETVQITTNQSDSLQPLYVIIAGNKQNKIVGNQYSSEKNNPIADIDPDWIEKISVYKGDAAINKYGQEAENGVVVIEIDKDKVKLLPADLRKGLKRIK